MSHEKGKTSVVWGGLLHRENKKMKVSVEAGLARLKLICLWKDGPWKSSSL